MTHVTHPKMVTHKTHDPLTHFHLCDAVRSCCGQYLSNRSVCLTIDDPVKTVEHIIIYCNPFTRFYQ